MAIHCSYTKKEGLDLDAARILIYLIGQGFEDNGCGGYNSPDGHTARIGSNVVSISINHEADIAHAKTLVSGLVNIANGDLIFPDSERREAAFFIDSLHS